MKAIKPQKIPLSQPIYKNRLHSGLLIAVIVGIGGLYMLLSTRAAEPIKHYVTFKPSEISWPAGTVFAAPVIVDFGLPQTQKWQVNVLFTSDRSKVQYVKYVCARVANCFQKNWNWQQTTIERHEDTVICFNWNSTISEGETVFTMYYKAKVDLPSNSPNWYAVSTGIAPGTCQSNPRASGVVWSAFTGVCHTFLQYQYCDQGPGGFVAGTSDPGKKNNTSGDKKGNDGDGQGGGAGGGGGGSSATKNGDKSNTVPSSSDQGSKKQPTLEPSPFFDGKLFAVGSDSDSSGIKGVSVAGRAFGYGWLYLLVALLIAGLSGYFGWRWWRRRRRHR